MLRLIAWLVSRLSRRWTLALGKVLGGFVFSVIRVRRAVTIQHIETSLGTDHRSATRLAQDVYVHLATGALEFLQLGRITPGEAERILGDDGLARLRRLLSGNRGVLILTAHLGQWDMFAAVAAICGLPVHLVTRQIKAGWLNKFWMSRRNQCGVGLLPHRGSAGRIVRILRKGGMVAMALDQHQPGGIIVPFLGRPASTSDSLARLALATGCDVVPAVLLRDGEGFRPVIGRPLALRREGQRKEIIKENTILFNRTLEDLIRLAPEQWLWLHRRWKV